MSETLPKSIVIVGGGASATLLLAQLCAQFNNFTHSTAINIYIVEDSEAFNQGLAYSIDHPSFTLNVAANKMGAWNHKPDDFYRWLNDYPQLWRNLHSDFSTINYSADDFVPRMIYGAYLRWIYNCALTQAKGKNIHIQRVKARVKNIEQSQFSSALLVKTNLHETIYADAVVVATGNSLPKHSNLKGYGVFTSPYQPAFIQQDWSTIKRLIIVGSGLSMVDAVQHLAQQNFQGKIHIFSRHGLTPLPHLDSAHNQEIPPLDFAHAKTAKEVITYFNQYLTLNNALGIHWQTTINSLRANINNAWLKLSAKEQEKLRRLLPWWNIARHRIPVVAYELLQKLKQEGKLTISKEEIREGEKHGKYFLLKLRNRNSLIQADKLVVCSGYCQRKNLESLCGKLLNETSLSLKDYKLSKHHALYAIGPALSQHLFETTAIHEIRQQSEVIALSIVQRLNAEQRIAVTE